MVIETPDCVRYLPREGHHPRDVRNQRIKGEQLKMRQSKMVRFGWIEASLRYSEGFAGEEKTAYGDHFGIKRSQVSLDQDKFLAMMNERTGMDTIRKEAGRLILSEGRDMPLEPMFELPTMKEWLKKSIGSKFEEVDASLRVQPNETVLRSIVTSIRTRRALGIRYVSRTSGESTKTISPHVIVDVVNRLHVRAYDHGNNRFADFVLGRIRGCYKLLGSEIPYVAQTEDKEWSRFDYLKVSLSPKVKDKHQECIVMEFDLDKTGRKIVRRRKAVTRYLIEHNNEDDDGFASPVIVSRTE